MKTIKIINGVFGYRPAGSKFIMPKQAGDPPFKIEEEKAARLVALKVAEYVDAEAEVPFKGVATGMQGDKMEESVDNPSGKVEPSGSELSGQGDNRPDGGMGIGVLERPEYSVKMKMKELRKVLDDCQLTFRAGMSKGDVVALLDDYFNDISDGDEDQEDEEDFPGFTHEDVVP